MSIEKPRLSANTREYEGINAFDNDKFKRKELAEKLTGYVERLNDGAVIAIDAPWGEGKTWFGRNWNKQLKSDDFKTIYIDAFEQDYIDEPFVLLSSELLEIIKEDGEDSDNFTRTAAQVAKSTLSIGAKIGLNLVTKVALGNIDLGEEVEKSIEEVGNYSADTISKSIENRFDNYKEEKEASTIEIDNKDNTGYEKRWLTLYLDLHNAYIENTINDFRTKYSDFLKGFYNYDTVNFMHYFGKKIDIDIER